MRVGVRYFVMSGALGGLLGFLVMELATLLTGGGGGGAGILRMALYFAGFGLAVGAALGSTEGLVRKNRRRLVYGLIVGLLLGAAGGFLGGGVGQALFGLVPVRFASESRADLVVALDSSGSMAHMLLFGSDPWGKRKKAAKRLIDRLSATDRIAVVDFDERAVVRQPLVFLDSGSARDQAKVAVAAIDSTGGTDLSAGLEASLDELDRGRIEGRPQHIIFLTDGMGSYYEATTRRAQTQGVVIHTVGLGDEVNAVLLRKIAEATGGKYYAVDDAGALPGLFEKIFSEEILMTQSRRAGMPRNAIPLTSPILLYLARVLSWAAVGLAIGAGQGVRENTREDLKACALGGFLGGAAGGALFNPITAWVSVGAGLAGRALADVVVGASIGGSIRFIQDRMVEATGKPTTKLLDLLPDKSSAFGRPQDTSTGRRARDRRREAARSYSDR